MNEIVLCDFEYKADPGERPVVHCMVAFELISGKKHRLWADELGDSPPFACGENSLFVAFVNSAEFSCYHVLDWPLPKYTIDLHAEFRVLTNQEPPLSYRGSLLDALGHYNLPALVRH